MDEIVRDNADIFRRLSIGETVSDEEFARIPETLTIKIDGGRGLSGWGDVVWGEARKGLYSERLLEPPSPRMEFSDRFRRDCDALTSDLLFELNKRLDDLSKHLRNPQHNPRSLDFKALKGNPLPPSTHEFDVSANQGAKRVFCHYENVHVLILDSLGSGLH